MTTGYSIMNVFVAIAFFAAIVGGNLLVSSSLTGAAKAVFALLPLVAAGLLIFTIFQYATHRGA